MNDTMTPPTAVDVRVYERAALIDDDAEKICLSAIINDEEARLTLPRGLSPNYFISEKNRLVFFALRNLSNADQLLSNIAVASECRRLAKTTKSKEIVTPLDVDEVRRVAHGDWRQAEKRLCDLRFNREIMDIFSWGIAELDAAKNPSEMATELRSRIAMVAPPTDDDLIMDGSLIQDYQASELDRRQRDHREGRTRVLTFPWPSWQRQVGNHKPGKLFSFFMPDGEGKSTVMQNLCEHLASEWTVFYFNLEDPTSNIIDRMGARHTGIQLSKIETGDYDDIEKQRLNAAYAKLAPLTKNMKFFNVAGATAPDIIDMLHTELLYRKAWLADDEWKPMVIIDYYHAMQASRRALQSNRDSNNAITADVHSLVAFSGRYRIPFIGAGQVTKAYLQANEDERDRLGRTGAHGSSAYMWDSRVIVMAEQEISPAGPGFPGTLKYTVAKNNDGKRGAIFRQHLFGDRFYIQDIEIKQ